LKEVPRTGWLDRGITPEETESVADHSFGVALLAWLLAPDELDRARVVELALLHDLAESAVGDATPYDRDTLQTLDPDTRRNWLNQRHIRTDEQRAAKQAAETEAIASLAAALPPDRRDRLQSRWSELSDRTSPEARFVKDMDILETWLQSRRYAERHPDAPMESFELEARSVLGDAYDLGLGE
jgi:putative hydrolase of HD superfamily